MVIRMFVHYIISFRAGGNIYWFHFFRAGGNGLAAPVFGWTSFSQGKKNRSPFYKKQVVKKSASVICWTC